MAASTTVVFADLTGSTGVFEALGNERATKVVTGLTQWIADVCVKHGGRVVKLLGDGVLALFPDGERAIDAAVDMQRAHLKQLEAWPHQIRMRMSVGAACGEIVEVDGDCYGDAVNVASRLSDLSGADQIWATQSVIDQCKARHDGVRFRSLGDVPVRGKTGKSAMFRVEWQEDVQSTNLTIPGALLPRSAVSQNTAAAIELSWLDQQVRFGMHHMPVNIGRDDQADFNVNDQRVSRIHAKLDWRHGNFVLIDMSSFGTWVRFAGNSMEFALRRNDCVLAGAGDIALGASFDDFTVPTIAFRFVAGGG